MSKIISIASIIVLGFILMIQLEASNVEQKVIDNAIISYHDQIYNNMELEFNNGDYPLQSPYIVLDPYESSPLSAMLGVKVENESTLTIVIHGKDGQNDFSHTFEESSTEFLVPILGLYADTNNIVDIIIEDGEGIQSINTIEIQTEPLPTDFGTYTVTKEIDEVNMSDELYYSASFTGYMNGMDDHGNIRWYIYQTSELFDPFFDTTNFSHFILMDNGHYLAEDNLHHSLIEIDSLGRVYQITNLDFDIHHEFMVLDDGNYLVQSQVDGSDTMEDTLSIIEPGTANVLFELDYKDILDVNRAAQPYSTNDWLHANSIDLSENGNSLLTSSRHQNAVFSINTNTLELEWILGAHENWVEEYQQYLLTPVDSEGNPLYDLEDQNESLNADYEFWNWGQHSAKFIPSSNSNIVNIIIFNNNGFSTYDSSNWIAPYENSSSPRIYQINLDDMTVQLLWETNHNDQNYYSGFVGSARYYGDTVLTNYGATNIALNFGINVGNADDVPMDIFNGDMYFTEPILTTARIEETDLNSKETIFAFEYTDLDKIGLYNNGIFAVEKHAIYN